MARLIGSSRRFRKHATARNGQGAAGDHLLFNIILKSFILYPFHIGFCGARGLPLAFGGVSPIDMLRIVSALNSARRRFVWCRAILGAALGTTALCAMGSAFGAEAPEPKPHPPRDFSTYQ